MCLAAPTEDDQLRVEFCGSLDDALGRPPSDPHGGVDRHSFGRVVEDPLEEPTSLAGHGGALAQGRSLGHFNNPEDGQAAVLAVQQRRSDSDQLLGGQWVGHRDQDPGRKRRAGHSAASL